MESKRRRSVCPSVRLLHRSPTKRQPKGEQVMTRLPGQRGRSRLPSRRDIESDKAYGIDAVLFSGSVA